MIARNATWRLRTTCPEVARHRRIDRRHHLRPVGVVKEPFPVHAVTNLVDVEVAPTGGSRSSPTSVSGSTWSAHRRMTVLRTDAGCEAAISRKGRNFVQDALASGIAQADSHHYIHVFTRKSPTGCGLERPVPVQEFSSAGISFRLTMISTVKAPEEGFQSAVRVVPPDS